MGRASGSRSSWSIEDLKNKQRDEIRDLLVEHSRQFAAGQGAAHGRSAGLARPAGQQGRRRPVDRAFATADEDGRLKRALASGWPRSTATNSRRRRCSAASPSGCDAIWRRPWKNAIGRKCGGWSGNWCCNCSTRPGKTTCLSMDHLRSSVGLRGYAQIDPKVEYKREGMRIFEQMWTSVGERTTDLIFRMEQLDEGFVGSTWKESEAIHQDAQSAGEIAAQQQAAIEGTEVDHKPQPIRNRQQRVGRNDPCPCGSGKKFKKCCMKKG